jgi:hypothetical protein
MLLALDIEFLPCPCSQLADPAESTPASFRSMDVRPKGVELLVGTHRCDIWEINPRASRVQAQGLGSTEAHAGPGLNGQAAAAAAAATATRAVSAASTAGRNAANGGTKGGTNRAMGSNGVGLQHSGTGAGGNLLPECLVRGHTGDVYGAAFHPKKPHKFVTACESNNVFLWHARRRQLIVSCFPSLFPPPACIIAC